MKIILITLVIGLSLFSVAQNASSKKPPAKAAPTQKKEAKPATKKIARADLLKGLHEECMKQYVRSLDKRKLACDCLVRSFKDKLSDAELEILLHDFKTAKARKGQPPSQNDPNEALMMFSMDASEACINNPKWKIGDPE